MEGVNSGIQRIRECPLKLEDHDNALCGLHAMLDSALESVESSFRSTTIQSLLITPTERAPLCSPRIVDVTVDGDPES
jgi:hypothetical protein